MKYELQEKNLDEMIMDIEVSHVTGDRVKVKFVAIAGGTGPELALMRPKGE